MTEPRLHALSFDVEEFFQVANLRGHFSRSDWDAVPSRLEVGMGQILAALERHGAQATFFWLGWVAERAPDLVRRCLDGGHEIASHGYEHEFLGDLGPERLERDLERTEEALDAAGPPRPIGFRASTFTLTRETWWALDVLVRRGYLYDSSVFPTALMPLLKVLHWRSTRARDRDPRAGVRGLRRRGLSRDAGCAPARISPASLRIWRACSSRTRQSGHTSRWSWTLSRCGLASGMAPSSQALISPSEMCGIAILQCPVGLYQPSSCPRQSRPHGTSRQARLHRNLIVAQPGVPQQQDLSVALGQAG